MDFALSSRAEDYRDKVRDFMERHCVPANREFTRLWEEEHSFPMALLDDLKAKAKAEGLWNFFIPALRDDEPGTRMSNLDYAPLAEEMGRLYWASEVFNCNAPDTGNMELLHLFATDEQYKDYLRPLLEGEIRSCFSMTEPGVASSDATNIATTITRDGDEYVVNGRKWFITGAEHPNCKFTIVLGLSDQSPDADPHSRHSMVIVPMDAPGLKNLRNIPIMGHHSHEGHCELVFDNVRVPAANLLGEEGKGFALAQARLGPGRIHHCMRTIGQCEVAMELMCDRALQRKTFGKSLDQHGVIADFIGRSRMEIDQARLLVLHAAWKLDQVGNKAAKTEVSMIKVVAAKLQTEVLDRAIQIFGAAGMTPDTPLAFLWTWGRAMRFVDGPDEVHMRGIARAEIKKAMAREAGSHRYLTPFHDTPMADLIRDAAE